VNRAWVPLAGDYGFPRESTPLLDKPDECPGPNPAEKPPAAGGINSDPEPVPDLPQVHRAFSEGPTGAHPVAGTGSINERPAMSIFPEIDHSYADLKQRDPTGYVVLWLHVLIDAVENLRAFKSRAAEEFIFDEDNEFFDAVALFLGFTPEGLRDAIRKQIRDPQQRRRIDQVERS